MPWVGRRGRLRPGPEHWRLRQVSGTLERAQARDQKQDVCRPTTDGAATRKRRAAGKRKRKKDVSPKRTGLTARLPFGRPISPEGQSEAIAAGRKPSKAPGKTRNREIGKNKKGRKRPIKRANKKEKHTIKNQTHTTKQPQ